MDIGIVGGGIFGVTVAIELGRQLSSASIDLFEKNEDILCATSAINQCRLHRGYHYPRSMPTSRACKRSFLEFCEEYRSAIISEYDHYYCIASEDTKTTPTEFVDHCENLGLKYEVANIDVVQDENIDLCLRVKEDQFSPTKLREICWDRLRDNNINVKLKTEIGSVDQLGSYDYVIVATYSRINTLLESYPKLQREYKYQIIEKPVADVPESFNNMNIIVLDGPFLGINPFGQKEVFHFDHVVHGVRHSNVGFVPEIDEIDPAWLDNDVIEDLPDTNFPKFIEHGSKFFKGIESSQHLGSKFTVRTVLPNVGATDSRPTLIDNQGNVFVVFAGKITTCVEAADRLTTKISVD